MLQTLPRMISLEGGEGAGKSTVIALITKVLRELGESVVQTREPAGQPTELDANSVRMTTLIYPSSTSPLGGAAWGLPA